MLVSASDAFWYGIVMIISGFVGIVWNLVVIYRFNKFQDGLAGDPSSAIFIVPTICFFLFFCSSALWCCQFIHR